MLSVSSGAAAVQPNLTGLFPSRPEHRVAFLNPGCFPGSDWRLAHWECCHKRWGLQGNSRCWGWEANLSMFLSFEVCCTLLQPARKGCPDALECWDPREWEPVMPRLLRWGVTSQGTQDSVLALLFGALGISNGIFVEFGYQRPEGANTELLQKMVFRRICGARGRHLTRVTPHPVPVRWSGLLFDRNPTTPGVARESVRMETVVDVFRSHIVPQFPDYVSIDIDSCDLWVFLCLTQEIRPRIVSIEYNNRFPRNVSAAANCLSRDSADMERGYLVGHGASLRAVAEAAALQGYVIVWVTETDAFLIRGDLLCQGIEAPSIEEQLRRFVVGIEDLSGWRRLDPKGLVDVTQTLTSWGPMGLRQACQAPGAVVAVPYHDMSPSVFDYGAP